ncbi:MAG TPA: hypothetical protein VMY76_08075 [Gemmatimonadales bacterium]|nr:hypothetical protein [Gemmatimonadales bacterium]
MDAGPLLLMGFMWMVVNALRKAGKGPPEGTRPPSKPRSQLPTAPRAPGTRAPGPVRRPEIRSGTTAVPSPGSDATQREGLRLEQLLRELGRTLDQASGPLGRPADLRLPSAEEEEELATLEVQPEVRSLETIPNRPQRAVVDQDDQAERVIAQRLKSAEAIAAPRTAADHRTFDKRIRQESADHTATREYSLRRLREAVVWREILGQPVSLRRDDQAGE